MKGNTQHYALMHLILLWTVVGCSLAAFAGFAGEPTWIKEASHTETVYTSLTAVEPYPKPPDPGVTDTTRVKRTSGRGDGISIQGRTVFTGPRGGRYYIDDKGKKHYIRSKEKRAPRASPR